MTSRSASALGVFHLTPGNYWRVAPGAKRGDFFVYLYARDNEDELIRVAAPQPWDQPLGRTF